MVDNCRFCGEKGPVYTALGGALLCDGCIWIPKTVNFARLKGGHQPWTCSKASRFFS